MLLPYNVDRPARRTPTVTYALMAVNIAVYLLTILYTNAQMYSERPAFEAKRTQIIQLLTQYQIDPSHVFGRDASLSQEGYGSSPWRSFKLQQGAPLPPGASAENPGAQGQTIDLAEQLRRLLPQDESRRFWWNEAHRGDVLTFDIGPDFESWLAYVPASPSPLTLLTAMFLHANLEHILGNMLFLWVFGRAVEDTLGQKFYLSAYLLCGVAATLLFHAMTRAFSPEQMGVSSLGASGAIAGVQGLFAPRFYRTPVRVFYLNFLGIRIFYFLTAIVGGIFAKGLGLGASGFTFATLVVLAGIVWLGDETLWGEWRVAAAWLIGGWLFVFDVIPIIIEAFTGRHGGVAHWAHIGGFLCGVAYAFLIGSHKDGKSEYLVDDTRQSLDMRHAGNALESAQQVVMMRPDDPVGYQLLAEAHDRKDNREEALKNYKIALGKYLRQGERSPAAKLYQNALLKHPDWLPEASTLFTLASQMAKDGDWKGAGESLAKLPYYYPEASEGEMAFLRAAQIYVERLDQPDVAMQLLHEFGNRFPHSQWMEKATSIYQAASQRNIPTAPQ